MVYRRFYRRGINRKYRARKGVARLSKYNTYKNRSSAAQASQIYSLARRMNRIQRLTKPEVNVAPLVQGICLSTAGTNYQGVAFFGPYRLTNVVSAGMPGASSNTNALIEGRFARLQNITLKGVFTYDMASDVDAQRMLCYMRIVIIQTKTSRTDYPDRDDVFSTTIAGTNSQGTSAILNEYAMIRAPLKYGLARVAKVLSDKTYMISDTRQALNIKTKLKYLRNWYKAPDDSASKGDVLMFVAMYNTQGLIPSNISDCRFNYVSKCVFTDA